MFWRSPLFRSFHIAASLKAFSLGFTAYPLLGIFVNYFSSCVLFLNLIFIFFMRFSARDVLFLFSFFIFVFASILFSVISGNAPQIVLELMKGIFIFSFFILPSISVASVDIEKIFVLVGWLVVLKLVFNFIVIMIFYLRFISFDYLSFLLGDVRQFFRVDVDGVSKLLEKLLIFSPTIVLLPRVVRNWTFVVVAVTAFFSFTVSFYISFFLYCVLELVDRFGFRFRLIVFFSSFLLALSLCLFVVYFKSYSGEVKFGQIADVLSSFRFFGWGVGVQSDIMFQAGDLFVENSFLNLIAWFGFFGLFISFVFFILAIYFFMKFCFFRNALLYDVCLLVFVSIFFNSLSNPYLISSSVLLMILLSVIGLRFKNV